VADRYNANGCHTGVNPRRRVADADHCRGVGATIRVVLDWATGVTRTFTLSTYNQYILLRYAALGIVAGGLAGVSFVLAQLFSAGATTGKGLEAQALGRLVPFLIIIGFAAGLTAEVVLSNLRKSPPPVEVPVPKKG